MITILVLIAFVIGLLISNWDFIGQFFPTIWSVVDFGITLLTSSVSLPPFIMPFLVLIVLMSLLFVVIKIFPFIG